MEDRNVSPMGAVVLWKQSGRADRAAIEDAWSKLDLGDFVPPETSLSQATKDALTVRYGGPRQNIEPLPNKAGWAVMQVTPNSYGTLDGRTTIAVRVFTQTVQVEPFAAQQRVEEQIRLEQATIPVATLSQAVKAVVLGPLRGTTIRDGVYWIPEQSTDRWAAFAKVTERAASTVTLYTVRSRRDAESVRAITDAYRADLERAMADLDERMRAGPGKRGMRALQRSMEALQLQVRQVESSLGVSLADLRARADELETQVSIAALARLGEDSE